MRSDRFADLSLFVVAVAWGSTYLATKALVPEADHAPVVLAVRMALAALVMAALLAPGRRWPGRAELATGGVTGMVLAAIFAAETYGVALTTATNAGVLISLTMVLTPLAASVIERRAPSLLFLGLVVLVVLGDALLATGGRSLHLHAGDALILLAALLRTVHVTVLGRRRGTHRLDPAALTTVQLTVVAVVFCATAVATGAPVGAVVADASAADLAVLAYLALVCTVFAFLVQTWAIRRSSPTRVALLLGTEPVWAAVIGVGLAHEHIGAVGVVGIVLALAATAAARSVHDRDARTAAAGRRDLAVTTGPLEREAVGQAG